MWVIALSATAAATPTMPSAQDSAQSTMHCCLADIVTVGMTSRHMLHVMRMPAISPSTCTVGGEPLEIMESDAPHCCISIVTPAPRKEQTTRIVAAPANSTVRTWTSNKSGENGNGQIWGVEGRVWEVWGWQWGAGGGAKAVKQ